MNKDKQLLTISEPITEDAWVVRLPKYDDAIKRLENTIEGLTDYVKGLRLKIDRLEDTIWKSKDTK